MLLRSSRAVIAMMQLRMRAVHTAAHSCSSSSRPQLCDVLTPAAKAPTATQHRCGAPRLLHQTTAAAAAAHARERSVRAKAEPTQAAAAAADDVEDVLDALYAQAAEAAEHKAAAISPAPAVTDDPLDALYDEAPVAAESQKPQAAAARAQQAPLTDSLLDTLYSNAAVPARPGSSSGRGLVAAATPVVAAAAAAAASDEGGSSAPAAKKQQQQKSSPTNSGGGGGGGGGGGSSSGRVPPTQVVKPDLPSDLSVFNNAVLLVDKPKEWTSFDACNAIKAAIKRLGVKKIGHAGTLDPAATGLLIICTGSGTKSIEGFMAAHKEYSGTLKLGEGTPSLDAETEVEEKLPWEHITDEQISEAAKKLTGDIEQVPPMYSALHHQGQRLHELARAGVTVERPARPVTITRFDVHRDPADRQLVHFYVGCTKGTYIRTLGHDLATSLGTTSHLVALRREAIGEARVDQAWEVQTLVDKLFAAIREQNPAAFKEGEGNSRGGKRGGRGRGRGGGRGGGRKQQQAAQQPGAEGEQQ